LYISLKEYKKALADYNTALNIDPELASTYYNRAVAHINLKKFDEALKDSLKAKSLGYALANVQSENISSNIKYERKSKH